MFAGARFGIALSRARLPLIAFAAVEAWRSLSELHSFGQPSSLQFVFHVTLGLGLLVLWVFGKSLMRQFCRQCDVAAVVFLGLFPVAVLAWGGQGPFVGVAAMALGSVGFAWFLARWFLLVCRFPSIGDACLSVLVTYVVVALVKLLFFLVNVWLPGTDCVLALVLLAMLPVCVWRVDAQFADEGVTDGPVRPLLPTAKGETLFLVFQMVLCVLLFGNGMVTELLSTTKLLFQGTFEYRLFHHLFRLAFVAFLLGWTVVQRRFEHYHRVSFCAVLVLVGLLALALCLTQNVTLVALGVIQATRTLVSILLFMVLVRIRYTTTFSPLAVVCCGRGLYELFSGVASLVGSRFDMLSALGLGNQAALLLLAACAVVFLVSCFLAMVRDLHGETPGAARRSEAAREGASLPDGADGGDSANVQAFDGPQESVPQLLQDALGLTEAEARVAALLYAGYSKKRIAEELVVSENTVRFHSKSIYTKLGVHSRDEAITAIGCALRK